MSEKNTGINEEFEEIVEVFKEDGEVVFPYTAFSVVRVELPYQKLDKDAKLWRYAHYNDSGMDVYSRVTTVIEGGTTHIVPTGIAVAIPDGLELQLRSTSGNAKNTSLRLATGVSTIDAGFRGEVCVILDNVGEDDITIHKGDKIAQAILKPVMKAHLIETSELPNSERGLKGFGESTGGVY